MVARWLRAFRPARECKQPGWRSRSCVPRVEVLEVRDVPTATLLASGLQGSIGSAVGPGGALFVAEGAAGRIARVDPQTGAVTTFASGLPGELLPHQTVPGRMLLLRLGSQPLAGPVGIGCRRVPTHPHHQMACLPKRVLGLRPVMRL